MPELVDYFFNDFKGANIDVNIQELFQQAAPNYLTDNDKINLRILQGSQNPIRMFVFYISSPDKTLTLILSALANLSKLSEFANGIISIPQHISEVNLGNFRVEYSYQIYFYIEYELTDQEYSELNLESSRIGIWVTIRSKKYAEMENKSKKPQAFISHDSRDKELIARPIFHGLQSRLCSVWYDEYSLNIGDSLKDSIEQGLKETNKCILILTPNFLKNPGWVKKEFDSIYTREIIKNERVFLPIWHGVTKDEIYEYSPELSLRVAEIWPSPKGKSEDQYLLEIEVLISKLHTAIAN
ncbi:toll/interleukin-1 receptor domain-containing protein [Chitinophaga lutea]|uniref:Toll/interleukin-1 receptor domain-containing protein n=1 Tax=Chitinophaga lutea TaxID=2488634 RepID=A0A3N4PM19_9BACT|nr:toll/interleukin-1 receptor domain-containing protein [Chitinophaga lutea]RPE09742.1 toll/interleukin-1 receptor domain-containing protein [Chitinophaga lutea]